MLSPQHLGVIFQFDFKFTDCDVWLKADISIGESLEVLKTGLLRNKAVSQVKLFSVAEDGTEIGFIYHITNAKAGTQPWNLEVIPT
jgi:hypothetical protein